jgi:hypothetical protein
MEQERPLKDRIWEFTKDISVKVSRKAEKHWKINTLRVEIASIKHRINVKYKELGRFVYSARKADELETESYREGAVTFFDELQRLEDEIAKRMKGIEILETEMEEASAEEMADEEPAVEDQSDDEEPPAEEAKDDKPVKKTTSRTTRKTASKAKTEATEEEDKGD